MRLARRTFGRLLALTGLACAGCGSEPASTAISHPVALRFLALGDSYTIGESVGESARWPVQLAARLREAGLDVADPQIIARTGWRTDDLDAAITASNPRGPFHLVSLLIGVNNQFQRRSPDEYRNEFAALLARAIVLANGDSSRVLVLSIPDWGATPFGRPYDRANVSREIDAFNAINREACANAGALYVDVTPVSRRAPQEPELVADDGLHPSGKMYAQWAALALPAARSALSQPTTNPSRSSRRS